MDVSLIEERLKRFIVFYKEFELLFCNGGIRCFNVKNGFYSYSDAIFLFCFLREYRPKRYFEVGSGFSSILTIETDSLCLGNSVEKKLIEPYPSKRLLKLLKGDENGVEVISKKFRKFL